MTQEEIEKLKDICSKEGFDLVNEDGRWYVQEQGCRIIWTDIVDGGISTSFRFQLSHYYRISFLKDELKDYLTDCLQKFVNENFVEPAVISCVCPNEIKTGTVAIHCCNLCGKPDEDWWGKH
jgi:hypothetical protein